MKKNRDKELLIEQLRRNPIIESACNKVNVVRATYYRWRKEDLGFAAAADAALIEGRSLVNDIAESQLLQAIKGQNAQAIIFWLRNNHPNYANRLEVSGRIAHVQEELTEEEMALYEEALRLALPQKKEEGPKVEPDTGTTQTNLIKTNDQPTA